jgi:hypothetical protein
VELHSENKGRLGDKFEGFQHPPSDAVWDRIAATPTDRPLGARFRMFAVVPNPRVWRRIAAQLQPQQRRSTVIWWSAAAGIALSIGFYLLQPTTETPMAKNFAVRNWHEMSPKPLMDSGSANGTVGSPLNSDSYQNSNQNSLAFTPSHQTPRVPFRPRLIDDLENGVEGSAVPVDFGHGQSGNSIAGISSTKAMEMSALPSRKVGIFAENKEETYREILFWQTLQQELDMQQQAENALANEKLNDSDDDTPKLFAQAGSNLSAVNGTFGPMALDANDFPELGLNATPLSLSGDTQNFASTESSGIAENYQTPLILGAYLDHPIGKGFGISGGLVYSKLQSTVEVTGVNFVQNMSLTRQFLGLAAGGTYTLPLGKHFATYASTGVQLDQGLGRHRVLSTRTGGTLVSKVEDRSNNGQQMSANLGLGIRYNLLKRVGLYAQGTAAHYFWQSEENLWTTKRVWPMMQVGVRVNL